MIEKLGGIVDKIRVLLKLDLGRSPAAGPMIIGRVQVQTAAAKTLTLQDSGTLFTTTGTVEATVTFTLPAVMRKGAFFWFLNMTAGNLVVASNPVDTLIAHKDATADSVTVTDIGCLILVFCDGASWIAAQPANYDQAAASGTIQT